MESGVSLRRVLLIGLAAILGLLVIAAGWTAWRAQKATSLANQLVASVNTLRADAAKDDLNAVGQDIAAVHNQAADLHSVTGDPLWGLAAAIPTLGGKVQAARTLGAAADSVATAAAPLATILPHFSKGSLHAGGIDSAVSALGPVLAELSVASSSAGKDLAGIDLSAVSESQAMQITRVSAELGAAAPTLRDASRAMPVVASLLGGGGPRTYFLGLENLAEARGTGGLVGAIAILTVDHGKIHLEQAVPRKAFEAAGPTIPDGNLPSEFRDLWGNDAREWAGLNLSRHFPYTGQLVVDGWKSYTNKQLDEVVLLDQRVVAALLAGTGPITVSGKRVDAANALEFLTRDIYSEFPVVADKDAVVVDLIQQVFKKITAGEFSISPMISAMKEPLANGDLLMYSTHADEQQLLSQYAVAGVLPDDPKPYSTVAIINGSGNKMEAYVSADVAYDGGDCLSGTRLSKLDITLTNSAPKSGLPNYVVGRHELTAEEAAHTARSSTKELLYIYGPVGSTNSLTTVDDQIVATPEGVERNHPVWRVDVVLQPGQTRVVSVQLQQIVDTNTPDTPMVIGRQPMANVMTTSVTGGTACTA